MAFRRLLFLLIVVGMCQVGSAQSPTYGVGRAPTADELRAWDISISPTGKELPQGRGTAKEGAQIYVKKGCSGCHAPAGSGGNAPMLIKPSAPPTRTGPCLSPCISESNVMGLHAPHATVIWDYINRGMPLGKEGSLTPDEVYALTAFLLFKNGVIQEDDVMDAQSLPKVNMPNREGYALPREEWKHGTPRLQGYP
jgi:S-disulfanyl-L-cysteine oxidoreductase SoxD